MRDEDLQRRLEKLAALRDHPSTLPAIREEAERAYEKLSGRLDEPGPGTYRRVRGQDSSPMERHIMKELNRQMARMVFPWNIYKPGRG